MKGSQLAPGTWYDGKGGPRYVTAVSAQWVDFRYAHQMSSTSDTSADYTVTKRGFASWARRVTTDPNHKEMDMTTTTTVNSLPIIHLNGSGSEQLVNQLVDAATAVRQARTVLAASTPHMRDYYPLANAQQAFDRACSEHSNRMAALADMEDALILRAQAIEELR